MSVCVCWDLWIHNAVVHCFLNGGLRPTGVSWSDLWWVSKWWWKNRLTDSFKYGSSSKNQPADSPAKELSFQYNVPMLVPPLLVFLGILLSLVLGFHKPLAWTHFVVHMWRKVVDYGGSTFFIHEEARILRVQHTGSTQIVHNLTKNGKNMPVHDKEIGKLYYLSIHKCSWFLLNGYPLWA